MSTEKAGPPRVAVVLCAGEGTRLRPLTDEIPAPLTRIRGRPLLGWNLEVLARAGIQEVLINLHHKPEKIISYLGDGRAFGISVRYYFEEELLGTAGALDRMRERLKETFLVTYGDVVLDDFPFGELFESHRERRGIGTVVLREMDRPGERWSPELSPDGRIITWRPPGEGDSGKWEPAGIYLFEPGILSYLPRGARWDLARDLLPRALEAGEYIWGFVSPVKLLDVGEPEGPEGIGREFGGQR